MEEFWFYIKLGLQHVLDLNAYDHILFLTALAIPFTFRSWNKILLLVTVFTITHCMSLVISVYELWVFDAKWIEFLIPVSIILMSIFNLKDLKTNMVQKSILLQVLATGSFGLIHGFGFSNYFKMLVMGEENKFFPLLGFASGIEISQVIIVVFTLVLAYIFQNRLKVKQANYIKMFSLVIIIVTIPLLYHTIPF